MNLHFLYLNVHNYHCYITYIYNVTQICKYILLLKNKLRKLILPRGSL